MITVIRIFCLHQSSLFVTATTDTEESRRIVAMFASLIQAHENNGGWNFIDGTEGLWDSDLPRTWEKSRDGKAQLLQDVIGLHIELTDNVYGRVGGGGTEEVKFVLDQSVIDEWDNRLTSEGFWDTTDRAQAEACEKDRIRDTIMSRPSSWTLEDVANIRREDRTGVGE